MNGSGVVVGVDIGGTFTDVAIAAADGTLHLGKLPTTPEDPRVGVVQGVRQVLADAGLGADSVTRVVHGTTLATNVVLERRGGPVALVTTEGFGDLMRLGRQARVEEDRYDVLYTPPPPPVDATLTFEVAERLGARGEVLVPLADDAVRELTRRLTDADPVGIAVCFLHSYANPAHEHRVAAACRAALPDAFVAASCDVWPEMREYERAMTTVVCARVGPVMAGYLGGLERRLAEIGIHCGVEVMESSGGVMSAAAAARRPVCTVESGGAAGVITAGMIGDQIGAPDVISFDMGGTTAKTGIVRDGQPRLAHSFQVGGKGSFGATRAGTGVPVKTPVVDLAEVGAGGGSRAWIDAGGALRVGPGSADLGRVGPGHGHRRAVVLPGQARGSAASRGTDLLSAAGRSKVGAELGRVLVAHVSVLRQGMQYHGVETGAQTRLVHRRGLGRRADVLVGDRDRRLSDERRTTREQLIEQTARGVEVGAGVDRVALCLLR